MIINVRGMHGSGKSTLVRRFMKRYGHIEPLYMDGRRPPIGYVLSQHGAPSVFVPGNYDSETGGGCDTIPNVRLMYKYIRRYAKKGFHVVYEGIVAQHGTPHIVRIHEEGRWPIRVLVLDIPPQKALRGVKRRRRARGNMRPLDETNFNGEIDRVRSTVARCESFGVRVTRCSTRARALRKVLALVGRAS